MIYIYIYLYLYTNTYTYMLYIYIYQYIYTYINIVVGSLPSQGEVCIVGRRLSPGQSLPGKDQPPIWHRAGMPRGASMEPPWGPTGRSELKPT